MRPQPARRSSPRLWVLAITAGLALTAAACSSNSATSSSSTGSTSSGPVTLRLGYLTNLTHASALVGVQDGYFKTSLPSNVTLQTSTYNAGPAEVTALLAGSLDAAYMGPNSAITAYSQGKGSIRIISGATSGGAALVVNPSITSPSQLSGKTIATPQLGNTQDVALRTWLKKQGLTFPGPNGGSGEVNILPQDNSVTLTSFEAGSIAGAWVPEPWATRMVSEGHGKELVNEKSLWPGGLFSTTVLVVNKDFLAANPTVVTDLLKGQLAVTSFLKSNAGQGAGGRQHRPRRLDRQAAQGARAGHGLERPDLHQRPDRLLDRHRPGPRQGGGLPHHEHRRYLRPRAPQPAARRPGQGHGEES